MCWRTMEVPVNNVIPAAKYDKAPQQPGPYEGGTKGGLIHPSFVSREEAIAIRWRPSLLGSSCKNVGGHRF